MIVTIALILAAGFCFLMLTPLTIEVDTDRRVYRIRLKAIATANIIIIDGRLYIRLWIIGWQKLIDPFRAKIEVTVEKKPAVSKKRRRVQASTIFRKAKAILRSFTVSFINLNIDTDDYVINAWLFPIAGLLTKGNHIYRINYNANFSLRFRIENRVGKLLFALTK